MRKVVLIIVTLFIANDLLFAQENISVFTSDKSGNMMTNHRFISPLDDQLSSLQFSTNQIGTTFIDSTTYVVKAGRFDHWEEEPGNFDVIQFYKDNRLVLTYKDMDGIVRLNDPGNPYANAFNRYSDNGYFMQVKLSDTTGIILFVGQHYGTDLAKLIIFAVTSKELRLVYNLKTGINSITKTNDRVSMVVQSNIPDEGETSVTHTIWSADGILKFKDN